MTPVVAKNWELTADEVEKQAANRHDDEAGASQNRLCGRGNGGVTGGNDLLEREHAVHTDRNGDIENGRDDQGQIHGLGQVSSRILHVPRGKGDDGESQESEKGQGDTRDDGADRRVVGLVRAGKSRRCES